VRSRGFSLVELLVTVSILALLASALVLNANKAKAQAREVAAAQHGGTVAQAIRGYFSVWIADTPTALLARIAGQLAGPDWTGAPPGATADARVTDRTCLPAFALIDPDGARTPYSWPAAPPGVGCVLGLRDDGGVTHLRAITWSRGSRKFYVDGLSP